MCTPLTHALVPVAAGLLVRRYIDKPLPRRFWLAAAVCGVLPDLDSVGFRLGIPYGSFFGHRGFSHSILFALLASLLIAGLVFGLQKQWRRIWFGMWGFLFCVLVSHDLLDAITDGGLGVAFFSPFNSSRYFLPWRPIVASPIGLKSSLSARGMESLGSELIWVWGPTIVIVTVFHIFTARRCKARVTSGFDPL